MKPLKAVKVIRWLSETKQMVYVFDASSTIYPEDITVVKENIYQDDNIEYAISKIAHYISPATPYYTWNKSEPILFDIENGKWKGYNVNPFKSKDRNSEQLKEPISYKYKSGLFGLKKLNIVFLSDFKDNKYYFTGLKTTNFTKRETILKDIYNKELQYTKVLSETYNRIDLFYQLRKVSNLASLFDTLHTTQYIQIVQWCNDDAHILYKLYKNHNLPERFLRATFNTEKIRTYNCINLYSILANGTYCKISINKNGMLLFSYILDLRNSVNWNDLSSNKTMVVKYLQNALKQKILLQELNINVKVYYNIDNSSFAVLSKKIGEYIDIFHVSKLLTEKAKNKILCVYKRSSNYNKEPIDLNQYVQSRLNMGINDIELIAELMNLGITQVDAENLVNNEINAVDLDLDKVKLENTGTVVAIEAYKQGYMVDISNCPSKKELNYLSYWLSRIIESTRKIVKKAAPIIAPVITNKPTSIPKSSSSKSSSEDQNIGKESLDLGSDDDFFKGGALGKQKHGYFMTLLKNADKDLFTENYARNKCQAAFQPLVLSKEEKTKLEKQDMLKYFDNIMEYGSKPTTQHFYTCPRLWCPESKIPLDYSLDDPKCPIENEEPMKLYWNKDKTKPRFVKLTDPDANGMSAPCCFKKGLDKKSKTNAIVVPKVPTLIHNEPMLDKSSKSPQVNIDIPPEKDENYIMNKTAPIPAGRFGLLPEKLYKLLFPTISYALCSKTLNKIEQCPIRHGIHHKTPKENTKKDSILFACSYLLGFQNKSAFINDIRKRLDLITFISLENGNVCKDFLNMNHVINKNLCKLYMQDKRNNAKYFDTTTLNCSEPSYKLSRLLNIYQAYVKFIEYLATDTYPDDKNAHYLYSLLAILYNVLLVVWEKTDNDINLLCSYYTSYTDILASLDLNPRAIMILKEGHYYEPIELKSRNEESKKILPLNEIPNLKELLSECNKYSNTNVSQSINSIYILSQYAKSNIYQNSRKLNIDSILISNDMSIEYFLTKGNILLKTKPISISLLPMLIKYLNVKNIIFYDDVVGKEYKVSILVDDLNLLITKAEENQVDVIVGKPYKQTDAELHSTLTIEARPLKDGMIIHSNIKNIPQEQNQKWHQLQKLVANKLLSVYDDERLAELNKKSRTDIIKELLRHFESIPRRDKNKLQIILEGVPIYSTAHIREWYNTLVIYGKYKMYDNQISETQKEFLFTQYHISLKIPQRILKYHETSPNKYFEKPNTKQYIVKNDDAVIDSKFPVIFEGVPEKLKSKWTKHKKLIWYQMVLHRTNYYKNIIQELYNWLAQKLGYKADYSEIEAITRVKYYDILDDEDIMMNLFSDPSFYDEYLSKMNKLNGTSKKFKTLQIFWDNYYKESSRQDRTKIINNILDDNRLYPNDLNLLSISEFLNISILIIHRTKYGKASEEDIKRGELEDLMHSSTMFPAQRNMADRPLLILGKEYNKHYCSYYAITEMNKNIYLQYKDAPNDIKMLAEAHL